MTLDNDKWQSMFGWETKPIPHSSFQMRSRGDITISYLATLNGEWHYLPQPLPPCSTASAHASDDNDVATPCHQPQMTVMDRWQWWIGQHAMSSRWWWCMLSSLATWIQVSNPSLPFPLLVPVSNRTPLPLFFFSCQNQGLWWSGNQYGHVNRCATSTLVQVSKLTVILS